MLYDASIWARAGGQLNGTANQPFPQPSAAHFTPLDALSSYAGIPVDSRSLSSHHVLDHDAHLSSHLVPKATRSRVDHDAYLPHLVDPHFSSCPLRPFEGRRVPKGRHSHTCFCTQWPTPDSSTRPTFLKHCMPADHASAPAHPQPPRWQHTAPFTSPESPICTPRQLQTVPLTPQHSPVHIAAQPLF